MENSDVCVVFKKKSVHKHWLFKLFHGRHFCVDGNDFLVVTGLSIYVVFNFFVFLFYVPMITENPDLANNMWDVHNAAYIILCILTAKAFSMPFENYNKTGQSTNDSLTSFP